MGGGSDGPRATRFAVGDEELVVLSVPRAKVTHPSLSAAEQEVAALLVAGRSNREIAAVRGTSVRTVANQVAAVLRKLGARSRTEVVAQMAELIMRSGSADA